MENLRVGKKHIHVADTFEEFKKSKFYSFASWNHEYRIKNIKIKNIEYDEKSKFYRLRMSSSDEKELNGKIEIQNNLRAGDVITIGGSKHDLETDFIKIKYFERSFVP